MTKYTVIRVNKADAANIKRLFPQLKNDAHRLSELVRIVSVSTLPGPADADRPLVVSVTTDSEEK